MANSLSFNSWSETIRYKSCGHVTRYVLKKVLSKQINTDILILNNFLYMTRFFFLLAYLVLNYAAFTQAQVGIQEPYGLDATIKALPDPHLNDGLSKVPQIVTPSLQKQKVETTKYKPLPKEVMDSIFKNNNSVKEDPFASKFEDASLSERHKGKAVFYGDHKLDKKVLDDRYQITPSEDRFNYNLLFFVGIVMVVFFVSQRKKKA